MKKLLSRLLGALLKPRDPLADLRVEPVGEDYWRLRAEWQAQDQLDALAEGEHVICGYTNVAYGTRGYSLHALRLAGLMYSTSETGLPGESGRFRYRLTPAGRAAAPRLRLTGPA
jgi:hypothetical protein